METTCTNSTSVTMPSSSLGGCLGLGSSSIEDASSVNSSSNSTCTTSATSSNPNATVTATNVASVNATATAAATAATSVAVAAASYYFGNISRETAEQILYDLGAFDGLFLIRDSTTTDSVLSLCHHKSILHYRISRIPSTGQVILHGTPIQVFPDFDTLIIKVQGLPIKPSIPADRNSINSLYSLNGPQQANAKIKYNTIASHHLYHLRHSQQQQQQQQQQSAANSQQQQQSQLHHLYSGGGSSSFYGAHIHYHHGHPNNRTSSSNQGQNSNSQLQNTLNHPHHLHHTHQHSHPHHLHTQASLYTSNPVHNASSNVHYSQSPVAHNLNQLNNQLNTSRSTSMWRLPLPEIKEAIIKKTKELGDELVYDTTTASAVFRSTNHGTTATVKLIPVNIHNNNNQSSNLDQLKEITLEPPPLPSNPPPATLSSMSTCNSSKFDLTSPPTTATAATTTGSLSNATTTATVTTANSGSTSTSSSSTSSTSSVASALRSITTYATLGRSKLKESNTLTGVGDHQQQSSSSSSSTTTAAAATSIAKMPVTLTPIPLTLPSSAASTSTAASSSSNNKVTMLPCSVCHKEVKVAQADSEEVTKAPSLNSLAAKNNNKSSAKQVSASASASTSTSSSSSSCTSSSSSSSPPCTVTTAATAESSAAEPKIDGLKCTFCGHCRHYKCDSLTLDQLTCLNRITNRYICLSCYDLAGKLLKSGSISLTSSSSTLRRHQQITLQASSTMSKVSKGTFGDVAKNEFTQSSISSPPHGMSSTGPSTTLTWSVVNSLANGSTGSSSVTSKAGAMSTATTTTINTAAAGGWNDPKVEDETATKKESTALKQRSRTECTALPVTSASTTTSFAANVATLAESTCNVVIVDGGPSASLTSAATTTGASNSMPSKEEMKQMIKEVVDDVIRSTITQVINEKVAAATVTGSLIGQTVHPVLNNQLGTGSNMSNGLGVASTASPSPLGGPSNSGGANEIIVTSDSIVTATGDSSSASSVSKMNEMNLPPAGQVVSCQCNCPESSLTASTSSGDTSGGGGCGGDSGSSIQSSDGSLGTGSHRILPSVTTLDKAAEERAKSIEAAKAEEDLLLLLKSPEVEVKNFLLKPKKHSKSASASASPSSASASASAASTAGTVTTSTSTSTISATSSVGHHHSSTTRRGYEHSSVSTVTAPLEEVKKEKAKELTHQLTSEQMDESSVNHPSKCNSVTDTVKSHASTNISNSKTGQGSCKDVQSTSSNCDTSSSLPCNSSSSIVDVIYANSQSQVNSLTPGGNLSSGQTKISPSQDESSPKKHYKCPVMDDADGTAAKDESTSKTSGSLDDDGEYESIRFDREDLDPKSCLGFAPFVTGSNEPASGGASGSVANCNSVTKVTSDDVQGGEDASWKRHPIKLNQLDLICLEEENQEKIQEMVRIYKKGPISLDPNFVTLRCKIGSGFFGEVYLATIPLRNSNSTSPNESNASSTSTSSSAATSSSTSCTASSSSSNGPTVKVSTETNPSPATNSSSSSSSTVANGAACQSSSNNNTISTVNSASTPTCNYIQVAVKLLKDSSLFNSRTELMKEASLMASLDHKHIIRLIGIACDESPLNNKSRFMMVLELAPLGPLSSFLQSPAGQASMSIKDILILMLQVSMGMQYLESKNFVHRDLAARNVLLVTESFAKISDFGMSRALGLGKDYYKAKTGSKWPLKWFAPECIYYFKFSTKSDVWAFGVTLWEALNYGAKPYEGMDSIEILRFLNSNDKSQRLQPPINTPPVIKDLLTRCWSYFPENRPTFAQIVQTLTSHLFLNSSSASTNSGGAKVSQKSSQV